PFDTASEWMYDLNAYDCPNEEVEAFEKAFDIPNPLADFRICEACIPASRFLAITARWLAVRWRRWRLVAMTHSTGEPPPGHAVKRGATPAISQAARRLRPSRAWPR